MRGAREIRRFAVFRDAAVSVVRHGQESEDAHLNRRKAAAIPGQGGHESGNKWTIVVAAQEKTYAFLHSRLNLAR